MTEEKKIETTSPMSKDTKSKISKETEPKVPKETKSSTSKESGKIKPTEKKDAHKEK